MMDEPILKKKRNKLERNQLILAILLVSITLLGGVYAYFNYTGIGNETVEIVAGDLYLQFSGGNTVHLSNAMFPETPEEARGTEENPRTDNVINFTINGKNTTTNKNIYYEIKLLYGANNDAKTRFRDSDLRFDLEEINGETVTRLLNNVSYETINNTKIWVDTVEYGEEVNRTYRLRVWIGDHVLISDTNPNASYTTGEYRNSYANIKVAVYGDFERKIVKGEFYKKIETSLTEYLLPDDGDARILSGGGGYNDGNPVPDANFKNYVWYSGKLWRIVALNNDGTIKLVTQHNITNIQWGENSTFYSDDGEGNITKSWMYVWLNEDFLDTLYNKENIVKLDSEWDVTTTNSNSKPTNPTKITASVGLLTAYEYTQSYSKTGSCYTGYLNNGYYWWLLTPYNSFRVRFVFYDGSLSTDGSSSSYGEGARPSINLSSNIKTRGGDGSLENPYTIEGDISAPTNNVTKVSERISGEYVNFNGETYRIVSIENDITKITKADYLKSGTTILKKYLSTSTRYGGGTSSDYWDYYLNNDWYNSISTTPINYKGMIVEGDWYLGMYPDYVSYKATICTEETINQPIKNCTKLTGTDDYGALVYNGYVGLGRVGEMFTSQIGEGYNDSTSMWTITPEDSSFVRFVSDRGSLSNSLSPSRYSFVARPSINLSSNIVITDGDGTINDPFEITLAS